MTDYSHWPPAVARVCEALEWLRYARATYLRETYTALPNAVRDDILVCEAEAALAALRAARPNGGDVRKELSFFASQIENAELNEGDPNDVVLITVGVSQAKRIRAALSAPAPEWRDTVNEAYLTFCKALAKDHFQKQETIDAWCAFAREMSAALPAPPAQEQQE